MQLKFYKYQGTGNDFILIDNRKNFFKNDTKLVSKLCDRKFGIGADGLILLENASDKEEDFSMQYYNADGNKSSMCGNGGRCIVHFAKFLGIIEKKAKFTAIDGKHAATINENTVTLQMQDVPEVKVLEKAYFADSGSPHHISFMQNLKDLAVKKEGAAIRNNKHYKAEGVNVNFVEKIGEAHFNVRTYERGVEDETLSCGTGVTAVAIAANFAGMTDQENVKIDTLGGNLEVSFKRNETKFTNIWLKGRVEQVFEGKIPC